MSFVQIRKDNHIAVLTLNRPERRNALGTGLLADLMASVADAARDNNVHVIVLAGNGPGFCAGADLKEFSGDDKEAVSQLNLRMAAFARSLCLMKKPVIAAVDGFAMGGGLVLATACDHIVTTPATRWQLTEVSLGWLPGFGLETLAKRVGPIAARRLTWGGAPLDGRGAVDIGLADELAETPASLETALKYAERLAALPPHAVASAKLYFAPMIVGNAEVMDELANRTYAADALHPAAQVTMQRFRK